MAVTMHPITAGRNHTKFINGISFAEATNNGVKP